MDTDYHLRKLFAASVRETPMMRDYVGQLQTSLQQPALDSKHPSVIN